jgi:hypothetical protein
MQRFVDALMLSSLAGYLITVLALGVVLFVVV